jgi:MoaA/NifB/PqqE/SkfB family radical SAM enzyme
MISNMMIEITTGCTRRCPICEASIGDRPIERLPISVGLDILGVLHSEGVTSFSFTGGEPLMYREGLLEFLRWASARNVAARIYTNGDLATPAYVEEIAPHLSDVVLSLDTLDAEAALLLRGTSECIDAAIAALDAFLEAGVAVNVLTVFSSATRTTLPDLGEYLSSRGIAAWWIQQFIPQGKGLNLEDQLSVSLEDFESAVSSLPSSFGGTIREFPAVGASRHRVYVNCRADIVEYDTGIELGSVMNRRLRHRVLADDAYDNQRRS